MCHSKMLNAKKELGQSQSEIIIRMSCGRKKNLN